MLNVIPLSELLQKPLGGPRVELVLEIVDHGADLGIDIRVRDPGSGSLRFEIVALNPESCPLIGQTPQSSAAFGAFCSAFNGNGNRTSICALIRFYPSDRRAPCRFEEDSNRNSRLLRMVEDIADEILSHRAGSTVEIMMLEDDGTTSSLM
jgi:hypothetical protein